MDAILESSRRLDESPAMSPTMATVVHVITQLELGGAQEITLVTCRRLDRRRFRVHLIHGPGGLLDDEASHLPETQVDCDGNLLRAIHPASDLRCLGSLTRRSSGFC